MSSRNVFLVSYHVYVIDNSQVDKYCRILLWLQYIADNNNIFVWKTICHILFHNTKTYLGLGVLQSLTDFLRNWSEWVSCALITWSKVKASCGRRNYV